MTALSNALESDVNIIPAHFHTGPFDEQSLYSTFTHWAESAAGREPGASPLAQEASYAAHREGIAGLAFNSRGTALATASVDQTARVWDVASGKPAGKPLRHRGPVRSVRFGDDDAWLLTTSADRTARLWDPATGAFSSNCNAR